MQLRHWKTQWIPLQIYVLIVGLKVKELLTVFLRIDTRLHQESTEKGWNIIIETAAWGYAEEKIEQLTQYSLLEQYDGDVLSNIIDMVLIYNDKDIEVVFKGENFIRNAVQQSE